MDINFIEQINDYSCGAACLQMVYSFYGLKVSQKDIYDKYAIDSRENSTGKIINTEDLVSDSIQRNFISTKLDRLPEDLINENGLKEFIDNFLLNN